MRVNLGPLLLTVLQFVAAALGYLFARAVIPPGTPNRSIGLFAGVIGAVLIAGLVYRRHLRDRLPAGVSGLDDGERAPSDESPGADPPASWAEDDREEALDELAAETDADATETSDGRERK